MAPESPLPHSGPGQPGPDGPPLVRVARLLRCDGVHPELEVRSAAGSYGGLRGAAAAGRGKKRSEVMIR